MGLCEVEIEEEIWQKASSRNNWELCEEVQQGLGVDKRSFPLFFRVIGKQFVHPADGWLICDGGLSVAKTSYGTGKIGNSGDQNCQHEFLRFIFSMLSTAWYFFSFFLSCCQKAHYGTPAYNSILAIKFSCKMCWNGLLFFND